MNTETYNRSLPLLAAALSEQRSISVEIGGSRAFTDGKTIHLPSLPLDADENDIVSTVFSPGLITIFVIFTEPFLPLSEVSTTSTSFLSPVTVNTLSLIEPSSEDNVPFESELKVTLLMYISLFVVLKLIVITSPLVPVVIALEEILTPLDAAVLLSEIENSPYVDLVKFWLRVGTIVMSAPHAPVTAMTSSVNKVNSFCFIIVWFC